MEILSSWQFSPFIPSIFSIFRLPSLPVNISNHENPHSSPFSYDNNHYYHMTDMVIMIILSDWSPWWYYQQHCWLITGCNPSSWFLMLLVIQFWQDWSWKSVIKTCSWNYLDTPHMMIQPASIAGARAPCGKEEPRLTILSLWSKFLDAVASPSTYPPDLVGQWVGG